MTNNMYWGTVFGGGLSHSYYGSPDKVVRLRPFWTHVNQVLAKCRGRMEHLDEGYSLH
jgi:hypothetical protein